MPPPTPLPVCQAPAGCLCFRGFPLLIVLVQGFEKCDKGRDVGGCERNPLKLACSVSQRYRTCLRGDTAIESNDVVQVVELSVVHIRGRMAQITEPGRLEPGDGPIEQDTV